MAVSSPEPVRDTLMTCFCRILMGRSSQAQRRWVRNELLQLVQNDPSFVILHARENCIYDRYRVCQLFAQRFHISVEFPAEGLVFESPQDSPYRLYLLHQDRKFVQLLPKDMERPLYQLYDLRMVQDATKCPVVGRFEPTGQGMLHQMTLRGHKADQVYTVHPRAGTDYSLLIPKGQNLYVFAEETCVAVVGPGDPVNPYFFVPVDEEANRTTLSIIVCESISRANQFLQTELYGVF